MDDPRDECDPLKDGSDCRGICVVKGQVGATTEGQTDQNCGSSTGKACPAGFHCIDNSKDTCDPAKGGVDCPGLCVKERPCDSRGLPPCLNGETCVHDSSSGCGEAQDCPGVCRNTTAKVGTIPGGSCHVDGKKATDKYYSDVDRIKK